MSRLFLALSALLVTFSSGLFAEESITEQCQRYALEDGATAEQMDEYMQQCITDLQGIEMEMMPDEESPDDSKAADRE